MKKKIIVRNQKNENLFELSEKQTDELNISFNELIKFSKNGWAFKIINLNYQTLMNTTDSIFSSLSKNFPNTWYELEQASIEFNRHFLNYLSSLNTFLDQECKFLSNEFGKNSDKLNQFKNKTSELFDNNFAYRLLYKIRNYTVHCGFSILSISSFQEVINNGKTKRITYIPYFLREELLENFDFGNILKPELQKLNEDIKVFDLVSKSLPLYTELNELVNDIIKPRKSNYKTIVKSILKIEDNSNNDLHLLIIDKKRERKAEIPYHYLK